MPARKRTPSRRSRGWVATVKTTAIAVPIDTMTRPAAEVAKILLEHNRKKTPGSINRFIQFYINRAGRGLSGERKTALKKAMEIIRSTK
jgi:predicted solute-binding protein